MHIKLRGCLAHSESCQSPWRLIDNFVSQSHGPTPNPIYPFPFLPTLTVTRLSGPGACHVFLSDLTKVQKVQRNGNRFRTKEQELAARYLPVQTPELCVAVSCIQACISCLDLLVLYEISSRTCQLAGLHRLNQCVGGERYCILHAVQCTYEFLLILRSLTGQSPARGRDEHKLL
jgi:hypothetical protein